MYVCSYVHTSPYLLMKQRSKNIWGVTATPEIYNSVYRYVYRYCIYYTFCHKLYNYYYYTNGKKQSSTIKYVRLDYLKWFHHFRTDKYRKACQVWSETQHWWWIDVVVLYDSLTRPSYCGLVTAAYASACVCISIYYYLRIVLPKVI